MERTVYEEKDEDDMEAYSFMNHLDSLATKEQDIFFREKEADFCCKI